MAQYPTAYYVGVRYAKAVDQQQLTCRIGSCILAGTERMPTYRNIKIPQGCIPDNPSALKWIPKPNVQLKGAG